MIHIYVTVKSGMSRSTFKSQLWVKVQVNIYLVRFRNQVHPTPNFFFHFCNLRVILMFCCENENSPKWTRLVWDVSLIVDFFGISWPFWKCPILVMTPTVDLKFFHVQLNLFFVLLRSSFEFLQGSLIFLLFPQTQKRQHRVSTWGQGSIKVVSS